MGGIGIILFLFTLQGWAENVRMGYFEIRPHMYPDGKSGKAAGASARYFEMLAKEMGYDTEWAGPLPFPRLIHYLQEGRVDGSLVIWKNPEREKFLHYPAHPYHMPYTIFVVKKDNPLEKISSIDDVKGYRVGFLQDANLTPFIKENISDLKLDLISGQDWVKNNLLKLTHGRLDAVYDINEATMPYEAKKMKIADRVKILPLPEAPGKLFVVFSKKAEKGKMLAEKYQKTAEALNLHYQDFLDQEFRMIE